jgi:hypothetical protein
VVIVQPPALVNPRPVILLDHGRHSSLVLPAADSGVVCYAYGEWRWYAERKTGVLRAVAAILWPTRGALGRRLLAVEADAAAVGRALAVGVEHLYVLEAEADAVNALRTRLDSLFEERRETLLYNEAYDLEFVHHPRPYWLFRTSNQMVAGWLEELGFRVHGPALLSRWEVRR